MKEFLNAMTGRAELSEGTKIHRMTAIVASYDPTTYSAKVMLQPSGTLTGWLPIETMGIGDQYGVAYGPQIGDQCKVDFENGDAETGVISGFIFSDVDRAPGVPSGDFWIKHKTGSLLKFNGDGTVELQAQSIAKYTATEHHFVGPVQMDNTLNVTEALSGEGGMAISGDNGTGQTLSIDGDLDTNGTITNNGHDIGSTHKHLNSGGSGLGGVPQ